MPALASFLPTSQVFSLFTAAAALAAFSALSELIGRFRDQPLRVVRSGAGLGYLGLNALLAVVVLAALRYATPPANGVAALEQVILAGFGARVLARTKVVGSRGKDGSQEEIGPGPVFDRILASISRTADRDRAAERLELVADILQGVVWEQARPLFIAELAGAMQDLNEQEHTAIEESLAIMEKQPTLDGTTRVHLLGYLVLNYGGEAFLRKLAKIYQQRYGATPTPPVPAPAIPAPPPATPATPATP